MLPRKAKGQRPTYCQDPQVDKLISMVMALTAELHVVRERIDTTERLAAQKGLYSQGELESYKLTEAARIERERWREEYLQRILWPVDQEIEGLERNESAERDRAVIAAVAAQ